MNTSTETIDGRPVWMPQRIMTDTEKLQAIRAKCVELLAIAEKRTQGEWHLDAIGEWTEVWNQTDFICEPERRADAAFIAACAGPAEAGWKSTIAAIDWILYEIQHGWSGEEEHDHHFGPQIRDLASSILAAWEGLV